MKRAVGLSAVAGLAVLSSGCASQMYGTWRTANVEPAGAGQRFPIGSITLNQDWTYVAIAKEGDQDRKVAGKWTYDGMRLRLTTADGTTRTYDARVWWGRELRVSHAEHGGGTVTVTMEKVTCEGKCPAGTCSKCDKRPLAGK